MGRRSDAKQKLLKVACELIWENSYGGVSVDEICEAAKVHKGSLYHFFRTKEDVAVAACGNLWETEQAAMDRLFSSHVKPLDRSSHCCNHVYQAQKGKSHKQGQICASP